MAKITGKFKDGKVFIGDKPLSAKESLAIVNHSPTGFSWGYSGSGPSQLALALLLKYTDKKTACKWYQEFKFDKIATLPRDDFEFDSQEIVDWLATK